jgi:hypothetical protein
LFAFGLRISRLPRFCSLDIFFSSASDQSVRSTKCKKPRDLMRCGAIRRQAPRRASCCSIVTSQAASTSVVGFTCGDAGCRPAQELQSGRQCNQSRAFRLSADILPLFRSETSSKPTF